MIISEKFKQIYTWLLPAAAITIFIISGSFKIHLAHQNNRFPIKSSNFYICEIADRRTDKNSISKDDLVELIQQRYPAGEGLRPIIINIKKLSVTETTLAGGRIDGKIDLAFSFDLKTGEDMTLHLVNYNGNAHYIRSKVQAAVTVSALDNTVNNALAFLDAWVQKQENGNPVLARKVELVFSDYSDEKDADTVYYGAGRKLTWDDFKDRPRNAKYAAEVIPGLGYAEKVDVDKGVIKIALALKVFLPKSAAWVRNNYMDDLTLNHEQRHFDIVKIVSEHFKQQLLKTELPVLNYDGDINAAYFDALREIDKMQKKYDSETSHGGNPAEQEKWNRLIDNELKGVKTYAAN